MSSQPESMAMAARAGSTPPHCGLPEEIFIWEILIRLPPKSLLRCRAVCWAWHQATSARDFLLAHHARQPSLPLLFGQNTATDLFDSIDIIAFDRRAGLAAADQLSSVARLRGLNGGPNWNASCDGIIISSLGDMRFIIYNPATRQYAPLRQLDGSRLLGMYMHTPTGEYRVLLSPRRRLMGGQLAHYAQDGYYVFTLGSGDHPRHIGYPNGEELVYTSKSVQFRGNLHWYVGHVIMVFDTITELFRQMRAPVVLGHTRCTRTELFEMDDMMGMSSFSKAQTIIDIWVLQDYEGEVWAHKCQMELRVVELKVRFNKIFNPWYVEAVSSYGAVLLLVTFGDWLLHVDINGKLVASFRRSGLYSTQLRIKQTLVSHTFFPTQEGSVVKAWPFI